MSKKKVLFIANHRLGRSPGQRFRFEHYLNFLNQNGFECELSNIISQEDDEILYSKGNYLKKASIELNARNIRAKDVERANEYDLIFIFREALLTGSIKYEKLFAKSKAKVIFDFDDAIWLPNVSTANKHLSKLKRTDKVNQVLPLVDMVFAGNAYLAKHASAYCKNVKIVPTTIDTEYHKRSSEKRHKQICIGWTGTDTTRRYLDDIKEALKKIQERYRTKIWIKIICDHPWEVADLEVVNEKWNKEKEIQQLEEIDIGIMPLTDDEWSRGKCGFKALQYMAMESATIVSPVGVNREIIQDGVNGYYAETSEEWVVKLSHLIESEEIRNKMGLAARKTVIDKYSVVAQRENYLRYFKELTD